MPFAYPGSSTLPAVPHLSELHGATTHLAVVAVPLYAVMLLARRLGWRPVWVAPAEPWVLGGAVLGVLGAGLTGLLVRGEAQTTLRGQHNRLGTAHFWLGIGVAVLVLGLAAWRWRAGAAPHRLAAGFAVLGLLAVVAQGYLGGRMTYEHAVGVFDAGQLAQSAAGSRALDLRLAGGTPPVTAGREAFSTGGLGCAACHGQLAQGMRGPSLAGGRGLDDFRRVHGHGLFPPRVVSDRDFAAVNAWLKTLPATGRREAAAPRPSGSP